jgi:hypothetical protein
MACTNILDCADTQVYNKDRLLYEYTTITNFANRLNINNLFNVINSAVIFPQDQQKVLSTTLNTYSSVTQRLPYSTSFIQNNAPLNELFIDISTDTMMYRFIDIQSILRQNVSIVDTSQTINNDIMDNFMSSLISSLCQFQFSSLFPILSVTQDKGIVPDDLNNAKDISLMSLRINKNILTIVNNLTDKISEIMSNELDKTTDLNVNIMTDFSNISSSYKSPFYYILRTRLADEMNIPKTVFPIDNTSDVMVYIRKIISDAYLKTFFPILHYIFINNLLNKYKAKGDYVNTRIALLSKIFLTVNIISAFKNAYNPDDTSLIDSYNKILSDYLTRLNNNDLNATPGTNVISDILKKIHTKSDNVVIANTNMNTLKQDVTSNQQALRNIVTNNDVISKVANRRALIFYIFVAIVLVLIITTVVFTLIGKLDYAYYVIIFTLFLIFILKVIQIIRSFVVKTF